ncbi:MAG: hypothetical protein R2771_00800 [Saprospiraceae bacterium]
MLVGSDTIDMGKSVDNQFMLYNSAIYKQDKNGEVKFFKSLMSLGDEFRFGN